MSSFYVVKAISTNFLLDKCYNYIVNMVSLFRRTKLASKSEPALSCNYTVNPICNEITPQTV